MTATKDKITYFKMSCCLYGPQYQPPLLLYSENPNFFCVYFVFFDVDFLVNVVVLSFLFNLSLRSKSMTIHRNTAPPKVLNDCKTILDPNLYIFSCMLNGAAKNTFKKKRS